MSKPKNSKNLFDPKNIEPSPEKAKLPPKRPTIKPTIEKRDIEKR